MVVGVPREIKTHEYRVAITPEGVEELRTAGHTVLVEHLAGAGSGFTDEEYVRAGAEIAERHSLFAEAELIVKVKEPLGEEYDLLRERQSLFTFLHLAPNRELVSLLLNKKITAYGYETMEDRGTLPLLSPMSEIAGRMSPIIASYYLQKFAGGSGVLPTGAVGVEAARAVVIGAGVVGSNAIRVAVGLGMNVTVLNRGIEKLRRLDESYTGRVMTLPATTHNIAEQVKHADIVIGAVLVTGAQAPMLVSREMIATMKKGSVVVDVSVDQGGCIETSRPTTHDDPIYEVEGVIHYAVANMPGAYPRTSTLALTNSTLPYLIKLANLGPDKAFREDAHLKTALNTFDGYVVHKGLAESIESPYREIN